MFPSSDQLITDSPGIILGVFSRLLSPLLVTRAVAGAVSMCICCKEHVQTLTYATLILSRSWELERASELS